MAKEAEATKKPGKSELPEEAADLLERIEKAEEACELAGSKAEIRPEEASWREFMLKSIKEMADLIADLRAGSGT